MSMTISGPAGREYSMGDAARLLGVSRNWIKIREDDGRLPKPRRTPGGHRTYSSEDLAQIRELALQAGMTLPDTSPQKRAAPITARIAIVNQKGGVGKTTITHNLGFALGNLGLRVLLVDLDEQFSLTTCCGVDLRDSTERGLGAALLAAAKCNDPLPVARESITKTRNPRVDLLPTNMDTMSFAESELGKPQLSIVAPVALSRILLELQPSYDLILIDCPPNLRLLTVNGLIAATHVVIPIDHHLSVQGLEQLERWVGMVNQHHHPLRILGVILNRYDARTRNSQGVESELSGAYDGRFFRSRLSQSSRVPEATQYGEAIVDYDSKNPVSAQFRGLAEEVVERLQGEPR